MVQGVDGTYRGRNLDRARRKIFSRRMRKILGLACERGSSGTNDYARMSVPGRGGSRDELEDLGYMAPWAR